MTRLLTCACSPARLLTCLVLLSVTLFPVTSSFAESPLRGPALRPVSTPAEPVRGDFDLELGYDYHAASPEGTSTTVWSVHQAAMRGNYGVTDRLSAYFDLPVLYPSLMNDQLAAPLQNSLPLLGDVAFGMRLRVWESRRPYSGLTLELRGQAPTGLEAAGDAGSTLLTGTGIPELGAAMTFRRQIGRAALSLAAGLTGRISQDVAYAVVTYPDGSEGDARFHPGNQADVRLGLQIDPTSKLRLELNLHGAWQGTYAIGTTSSRWFPSLDLEPIPDSSGMFADAGIRASIPLGRWMDLTLFGQYRFLTRELPELAALGLETFSPYKGVTGGLSVVLHL